MGPIMPNASTWVPPQNSVECVPARTDPDALPVLVVEERQGTHRLCLRLRGLDHHDGLVGQHIGIGCLSHLGQLFGAQRLGVREVEAQTVGRHQRTLLAHVIAEHVTQRAVQQVRSRVVPARGVPTRGVDDRQRVLPRVQLAVDDGGAVHDEPGKHVLGVEHLGAPRHGGDETGVADLATGLGVERGPVEHDLGRPGLGAGKHRLHQSGLLVVLVAGERVGPDWVSSSR